MRQREQAREILNLKIPTMIEKGKVGLRDKHPHIMEVLYSIKELRENLEPYETKRG